MKPMKLSRKSPEFRTAYDRQIRNGDSDKSATQIAIFKVLHGKLSKAGHIPLEQGGSWECPLCGRTGRHDVNAKSEIILNGAIMREECKS